VTRRRDEPLGTAFEEDGLARLDQVVAAHVGPDGVPGAAWLVARGGEVHVGVAGSLDGAGTRPVAADSIFRISSVTKPITAAGALVLVDDGVVALDDPVDELVPELSDRQVLVRPDGPLDETVPADRPITLRDLLTFRLGWGFDFAATTHQTVLEAMQDLEITLGPPAPGRHLEPDEWLRRLGTLPLSYQPGERWLYHAGAEVLGVLIARASGTSLGEHLRARLFEPLGMRDTGFWVHSADVDRFGPCFWGADFPAPGIDPDDVATDGGIPIYDATDGQWSAPPPFEDGGAGLVSTVADVAAFAELLLGGGEARGERILTPESVAAMTRDQLTADNKAVSGPDPAGAQTWGFGLAVQLRETGRGLTPGSYGWDGGLGSSWANDPRTGLAGVLLTNLAWTSPQPPPIGDDFWAAATTAVAG
jgi:CubicO group peptidase (beta-lactamase class C family)